MWKTLAILLLSIEADCRWTWRVPEPLCRAMEEVAVERRFIFEGEKITPETFWFVLDRIQTMPGVGDVDLLPDTDWLAGWCEFNEVYRKYLQRQIVFSLGDRKAFLETALDETKDAGLIYEYACNARRFSSGKARSSDAVATNLFALRSLIGNKAYYSGKLPAPVPFHRLRSLD